VDAARIASIPLFAELDDVQRERLAEVVGEVEADAGTQLASEGDFGYAMFAIEEGSAEVRREGVPLATLGPGDVFGEIAVLTSGRRIASVVALTPVRLLTLLNRDVWRLERDHPAVAESLRGIVRRRTEETIDAGRSA
jgi:CPA2 family monovalent cation:H+ antiporter-2